MEKINLTRTKSEISKSEGFALQLFLCLSLQNVLQHIDKMKESEQEWAWEQVVASTSILFPIPFEA